MVPPGLDSEQQNMGTETYKRLTINRNGGLMKKCPQYRFKNIAIQQQDKTN